MNYQDNIMQQLHKYITNGGQFYPPLVSLEQKWLNEVISQRAWHQELKKHDLIRAGDMWLGLVVSEHMPTPEYKIFCDGQELIPPRLITVAQLFLLANRYSPDSIIARLPYDIAKIIARDVYLNKPVVMRIPLPNHIKRYPKDVPVDTMSIHGRREMGLKNVNQAVCERQVLLYRPDLGALPLIAMPYSGINIQFQNEHASISNLFVYLKFNGIRDSIFKISEYRNIRFRDGRLCHHRNWE